MNDKLQRAFRQLLISLGPYIVLGIAAACIIGLFILSYYVLVWGILFGFFLWLVTLIKRNLFSGKPPAKKTRGRIIDHDKNR